MLSCPSVAQELFFPNANLDVHFFFAGSHIVVSRPDKLSGAEIAAICQEAGMHAVRKNRYVVLAKDLEKGYKSNVKKTDTDFEFYK